MNRELLKRYLVEFHNKDFSDVKRRELRVSFIKNKATSIVGPRRVGKTYFLFSLIKNVGKMENCLYIDFEHPLFYNITPKDIISIVDTHLELYPESSELYVFLDEVQVVQDWERMVRYLLDKGYHVATTGSSSKLLSEEVATHLRGRSIVYNLFNLSFREFLEFKEVEYLGENLYLNLNKIKNLLNEYLTYGAYPDVVLNKEKERILKEYLNLIVARDIVERHNIRNKFLVDELIYFGINNYSKYLSYDSLFKLFKPKIKITKKTLINYIHSFEDAMIFFFLRKYDPSLKKRIVSPRKIYLIDTGFGLFGGKDTSRDMENIVYIELMRRTTPLTELYYFKDRQGHEIDFVVKKGNNIEELIQVTYANDLTEITRREWRSLLEAMELLKCRNLLCITWDYEDEKELRWFGKRGKIRFQPLWKWLLNPKDNSHTNKPQLVQTVSQARGPNPNSMADTSTHTYANDSGTTDNACIYSTCMSG